MLRFCLVGLLGHFLHACPLRTRLQFKLNFCAPPYFTLEKYILRNLVALVLSGRDYLIITSCYTLPSDIPSKQHNPLTQVYQTGHDNQT